MGRGTVWETERRWAEMAIHREFQLRQKHIGMPILNVESGLLTRLGAGVRERGVDARERLLAAERGDRLEDAGETVVPVIATRIGWKTSRGFSSSRSTTPRSASSTCSVPNGSAAASRALRALRRRSGAPST